MNYLLDTHTLIWFLNGDKDLSSKARKAIESSDADNFISIASLWEISIKVSMKRLDLKSPFLKIIDKLTENNFQVLPIIFQDTLIISSLPFYHRDPFDRIMIAQSINNNLTIISKDEHFAAYEVKILW